MSSQFATAESGTVLETTRAAVNVQGTALLSLSFQALGGFSSFRSVGDRFRTLLLGICYAGIATSPLYALPGMWTAATPVPSDEDVIGVISTIVWALTLLPLVKYACHSCVLCRSRLMYDI